MNRVDNIIKSINDYGLMAKGRAELIKHLYGDRNSFRQQIIAKCYDCMGYMSDGKVDCEIPTCPLYPTMPYGKKPERTTPKKKMSPERIEKMRAGLKAKNAK